jgi:hypothetical protein
MESEQLAESARNLAAALTPGDLDHTLSRITAAAVEMLPQVTAASITIKHASGSLETAAPTHDFLCEVDATQYELQEGPCYEAAVDSVHVAAPDLANDPRFPRYAASALEHGIHAQAGVRLFEGPRSNGALNLYSAEVGAFADLGALGVLFQHQSAMAIEYAQEIDNLQEAVRTRKTIGQAVGIVMERYELNDQRAFAFLTRLSQQRNIKLRLIAEEFVAASEQRANER